MGLIRWYSWYKFRKRTLFLVALAESRATYLVTVMSVCLRGWLVVCGHLFQLLLPGSIDAYFFNINPRWLTGFNKNIFLNYKI